MNIVLPNRLFARAAPRALPALVAFFLGLTLFVATGFAWPEAVHSATHDARHALGLPCH